MKLWDVLATCLLLLSSVSARPLFNKLQPSKRAPQAERRSELLVLDPVINSRLETASLKQASMEEQCKSVNNQWRVLNMMIMYLLFCAIPLFISWKKYRYISMISYFSIGLSVRVCQTVYFPKQKIILSHSCCDMDDHAKIVPQRHNCQQTAVQMWLQGN